ncbi:MAG: hypothetical protein F2545_06275 [Actinobacteria bacterium]|nr:hypothetical protein [Actinomycetota bacterium]MTA40155.1 hypothetical protein [Actinomycetota bacterium]MTA93956.1 hypothetical protein [Actinomycetota bacterium]
MMFRKAFTGLDRKKWFDRMQPQTIAIATWLLYFEGGFTFLYWLDGADIHGFWKQRGGIGALLALISIFSFPIAGFLMANGKRLGWIVGIGASFSPFVLRALWKLDADTIWTWQDVIIGRSYVNFLFEAALCALLLHPMSRNYAKAWLR